ncbi:MAG TPA: T9SS type A sorting domain-containing protein [Candidatus Kapabacteria bacterium]|jgi:hypothetical protein|nr:T9SS type A sorting domain-containing protein [Candidatus Kapabacteria bacterium]
MKKNIFIIVAVLFSFAAKLHAIDSCACKKFPYEFCDPSLPGLTFVACSADPYHPEPYINPAAQPARRNSAFPCFVQGRTFNTGNFVWGGNTYSSVVIADPRDWGVSACEGENAWHYSGNELDLDDWMPPTDTFFSFTGERFRNALECEWYDNIGGCLSPYYTGPRDSFGRIPLDTTCCVELYFQDDPTWWLSKGYNVDSIPNPPLGIAIAKFDPTTCRDACNPAFEQIYLDVTSGFFSGPYKNKSYLYRGYSFGYPLMSTNTNGPGGTYVYNLYDFFSIWNHEMLHMLGLPHRDTLNGCGSSDPNSIMSPNLSPGMERRGLTSDDCCWLSKLYFPGSHPCPLNGVVNIESYNLYLAQSYPNPTTGEATIAFKTDHDLVATLEVYDILGNLVLTLADNQRVLAGEHNFQIGKDALPSGTYIYSLRAGNVVLSKEMRVVK